MRVWWDEYGEVVKVSSPGYANGKEFTGDIKVEVDGEKVDAVCFASEEDGYIKDECGRKLVGRVVLLPPDRVYSVVQEIGSPKQHYVPGKSSGTHIYRLS